MQRICDRIGILAEGTIVYQGALDDLLGRTPGRWRLALRSPVDPVLAALAEVEWARAVPAQDSDEITINIADADRAELELPRLLARSGARLVSLDRDDASLQDAFFRLTRTGPWHCSDGADT